MTPVSIKKTLSAVRYKLFGMEKLYILELSLRNNLFHNILRDCRKISISPVVTELTTDSKDLFDEYMKFSDEVSKANVNEWFKNGQICLLALVNDEIAGSVWISTKYAPYAYIPKVAKLFENSVYIFKLFISPPYRRKGLAVILTLKALQFCRELDFPKTGAIVYEHNKPSLRLLNWFGYKRTN